MKRVELDHLAENAQYNNGMCDISGALLYGRGSFLQVIEGPLHAINNLYMKIHKDPRHCDLALLSFVPIRRRHFAEWGMEVLSLDDDGRVFDRGPLQHLVKVFESKSIAQLGDLGRQAATLVQAFERQVFKSSDHLNAPR